MNFDTPLVLFCTLLMNTLSFNCPPKLVRITHRFSCFMSILLPSYASAYPVLGLLFGFLSPTPISKLHLYQKHPFAFLNIRLHSPASPYSVSRFAFFIILRLFYFFFVLFLDFHLSLKTKLFQVIKLDAQISNTKTNSWNILIYTYM